ncbi:MBL fold metallo-hydrolase [Dendrosporobacter sp. 1207_IL3150]|uniref:MBL fold metallo-hydrolase n=1 Tax=Dendrosporobacter sp. 1207_IL3150 TaxID=3084054 RepID=UPI002FDB5920
MKITKFEVGHLGTNCYIVTCLETKNTAIIDPGGNAEEIIAYLNGEQLKVICIVNTHGHADHIAANNKLKEATGADVMIHQDDAEMLTSSNRNLSAYIGSSLVLKPADRILKDGDLINVGKIELKVIHTPGHTLGGICLYTDGVLFSGDTLFAESVGRTDFPGGSMGKLISSIKNKLLVLPDETKVLPGHGPETSIGWERSNNPFI